MARREWDKPPSRRVGTDDAYLGGGRSGEVVTDALACRTALRHTARNHRATCTGSGRRAARTAPFKWVNTSLGNIRGAITGTYRKPGPTTPNAIPPASPGATTATTSSRP